MTDEPGIFTPFTPTPTPEAPAPKTNRRASGKRKAAAPVAETPATPAKRGRKPRTDKHAVGKARVSVFKVDFGVAVKVASDLKSDDVVLFTQIANALQQTKKGQRDRIVAAIGKVFA